MWEQFTPRMRQALAAAEVEAERLNRKPLRTDFLLLAVANAEESGSTALSDLGLTAEQVRVEVATSILPDEARTQLKLCVREAVNRARLEGEEYAGSEHVVAAVRATAGSGQTVLGRLGRKALPASPHAPEVEFKPRLAADPLTQRGLGPEDVALPSRYGLDGVWAGVSLALSGLVLGFLLGVGLSLGLGGRTYDWLRDPNHLQAGFKLLAWLFGLLSFGVLAFAWLWRGSSAFGFRRLLLNGVVICDQPTGRVWLRRRVLGFVFLRSIGRLAELECIALCGRQAVLRFGTHEVPVQVLDPKALAVRLCVPVTQDRPHFALGWLSWNALALLLVVLPTLWALSR